ncbi:helix-turn-helix transcriptional regulator [Streptomyces albospinus]|uniref:helix-turn-helix transcriptional regulator n=1 Tax=Streptomyces albospinus TaxID=285515 RepID=UPI001671214B|nr:LuxR family transcriptional regulator [Streptomyces albospinus]
MERRASLVGRDHQVGVVADALRPAATARTLLVTGEAGAGKTAVLDEARHAVVQEGAKVLRLSWETATGPTGAAALADAVCGVLAEVQHGRLLARVTAVRRAQARSGDGSELTLLSTLGETLADAACHVPFALVLDGAERMPPPTANALQLMLRVFRPAGLPVVIAGRPVPRGPAAAPDLATAADRVLDLPPLRPADVGKLVGQRLGRPAEPALLAAVRRSLGPLAGNPAAVLSVLTALDEDGRLVDLDGRTCLAGTEDGLRLTVDAEPLRRVTADGTDAAVVLAGLLHRAELRLEDLHSLIPACAVLAADLGRTVDRLVRERALTIDGDGRLAFAVPALAAALRTLPPRRDVRSMHAAVVQTVAERLGPATAGACHPLLADHVAAAGPALNDGVAVPLLLAAAARDARSYHPRAARAYLSALRRLPPNYPATLGVLREAAELGLGCGDHAGVLALGEPILAGLRDPGPTDGGGLEFAALAWGLSALHEHRSPYDDGAVPREVCARMPRAAMLAALGGRYGIGPLTPWPPSAEPAPDSGRLRDRHGPLPSRAELRTLAAAVGGHEELARAVHGLQREEVCDAAIGRLRDAAAYGDLAGALESVLGERYVRADHSAAGRYHAMVRDYLAGRWDDALSAARGIEQRSGACGGSGTGQLSRALAAEIHCFRGDLVRAREWLDLIPGTVVHPLVARARLGVRYWSGQQDAALEEAWHDVRRARGSGLLTGAERVLLRILAFVEETRPRQARQALEQLAALHAEADTAMTRESLLVARGVLDRDADGAHDAYRSAERRGDRHMMLYCCQVLAEVGDDPQPWLAEAAHHTHLLSLGRPGRVLLGRSAQRRNVPLPRGRSAREGLSEADVQLIGMVGEGGTNRQIAARLACSEKTVEQRLARLFQRTGRRSRVELVAAWLDGSLAGRGPVPDVPPGGAASQGAGSGPAGG